MVSAAPYPPVITNTHPDAVPAHWLAYSLAKILHCDISVWNIMIDEDNNGILIDWDCSRPVDLGEWHGGWRRVRILNFYHLIILICLTGNLAVHLCQSFTDT